MLAGIARRGVEILILDGRIDAGIRGLLHRLVDGKQAPQRVGGIGACFIETHGQNLLRAVLVWIFQIIGLDDRRPPPCDMALRADTEHGRFKKRGGIASAGKDGSRRRARHCGRRHFVTGV